MSIFDKRNNEEFTWETPKLLGNAIQQYLKDSLIAVID